MKNAWPKGYTLIEVLVVVLIIGILSSVALAQYRRTVNKTYVAQSFQMAKAIAEAQELYYLANGSYATNLTNLDISFPGCELKDTVYHRGSWLCKDWFVVGNYAWRGAVEVWVCPGKGFLSCQKNGAGAWEGHILNYKWGYLHPVGWITTEKTRNCFTNKYLCTFFDSLY